jgi:enoyl-CoA hydratase/carnithine racemase
MPGPHFGVVLGSRRLTDMVGEDAFRRLVLRDGPFTAQDGFAEGYLTKVAEKSGWTDIESRILADVSAIDAGTYAGILSQQRRDLRDSDLAALVRSGSDGSLSILSNLRRMAA